MSLRGSFDRFYSVIASYGKIKSPKMPAKSPSALKKHQGQAINVAHNELGLGDQTLRNWIAVANEGKLTGAGNKVVTPEMMELSHLRAENARLKRENEIIKKAAAYFAKDVL